MAQHNDWGRRAEQIAADFLIAQGYTIRDRNWRPQGGHVEIDIVTQQNDSIIFVEVKTRQNRDIDPADAIDMRKIRRLVRCAEAYLGMQHLDLQYRFDVITISGSPEDYTIDHIPDAFLPPLSTR